MTAARRRTVLAAAAVAAAGLGGCSVPAGRTVRQASPGGPHQVGILTPPATTAVFAAFDVRARDRDGLAGVLRMLSGSIAARSTVEVLVSAGASLFDDRFELGSRRPVALTTMPAFPNDVFDPAYCHGDLLLQVGASSAGEANAAVTGILRDVGAGLRLRWRVDGFRAENTTAANGRPTTRNLMGFREGVGNPDPADADAMQLLVWAGRGEPAWAAGGTYQVVRLIRFATQLWDREPLARQEAVIGRRREDGAPLGHGSETVAFDYTHDPDGRLVALDAHIRRANPRTTATPGSGILRRGYSYRTSPTDQGLVFVCFQQDPRRGFETVQRRLAGEALERYVLPFGGGYFFALPAGGAHLGHGLVAAAG